MKIIIFQNNIIYILAESKINDRLKKYIYFVRKTLVLTNSLRQESH